MANMLGTRQTHSRNNSHGLVTGANRIHRKSISNSTSTVSSITTLLKNAADVSGSLPIPSAPISTTMSSSTLRRNSNFSRTPAVTASSVNMAGGRPLVGSLPSPPSSLPTSKFSELHRQDLSDSAIDDEADLSGEDRDISPSDGTNQGKDRKGRHIVRCEKCGKSYKHGSCLTKHLWEHTPEWSLTSKLLISKHQQVQLLEAASVLVAMNHHASPASRESTTTPPDPSKPDQENMGFQGSGFSRDRTASLDFSAPAPYREPPKIPDAGHYRTERADSIASSVGIGSWDQNYSHHHSALRRGSGSVDMVRPPSSGRNATNSEDHDLAAAVGSLSCAVPGNGKMMPSGAPSSASSMGMDIPSMSYMSGASFASTGFLSSFPSRQPESYARTEHTPITPAGDADSSMEDDFDRVRESPRDDDEDGVFGRMEE